MANTEGDTLMRAQRAHRKRKPPRVVRRVQPFFADDAPTVAILETLQSQWKPPRVVTLRTAAAVAMTVVVVASLSLCFCVALSVLFQ